LSSKKNLLAFVDHNRQLTIRMIFRGINNLALDTKGRMAMPARYRERLMETCGGRLVVTVDRDRCLLVYPLHEWEIIESQLVNLPSLNKQARLLQRLLIGYATEMELDSQGRILMPTMLREYAQLDKKIVLIGQGKKFEIWDEQSWNENQSIWLTDMNDDESDMPSSLENLSL